MGFIFALLALQSYRHELAFTQPERSQIPDLGPASARPEAPSLAPILKLMEYKGRVTHINFWASWCAPCLQELPEIEKIYNDVNRAYDVILINADTNLDSIAAAREMQKRLAPSVFSFYDDTKKISVTSRELTNVLNIEALPFHLLLDQQGRVAASFYAPVDKMSKEFKDLILQLLAEASLPESTQ